MLVAAYASLRIAGQGGGAWRGAQTCSWVQQACALMQAHTRQASSSGANQNTSTHSDTSSSSSDGGSDSNDRTSEASSSGSTQQASLACRQRQLTGWGRQQVVAATVSPSAAAALGPASPAVLHSASSAAQEFTLHQPYSHFLWCYQFLRKSSPTLRVAQPLCTDIEELQSIHGSCPVQVMLAIHSASFDVKNYVLQHPVMQHHQQVQQWAAQASDSAAGSTIQLIGPFEAVLAHRQGGQVNVTGVPRARRGPPAPEVLVLQERLVSSEQPSFLLHIVPASPELQAFLAKHGSNQSRMVSRAGEGPGLQIFPGSVSEVTPAGRISSNGTSRGGCVIPRVLTCSQLPADLILPMKVTLTLMDSPGQQGQSSRQLGQWQLKAYKKGEKGRSIELGNILALADYVGYMVAKSSLVWDPTQGARLTLKLADTVGQTCRCRNHCQ